LKQSTSHFGRWLSAVMLVALAALQACSPGIPAQDAGPTRLRVCYSALTATQIPLLYAQENGFFAGQDLDVELFYFDSGTDAVTSLLAGETDLCQVAGSSVVNAAAAGEDVVFLAGLFNTYVYSLIVAPGVTTADDLRGAAVAVSKLGSSSDAAIRIALRSLGLEPDADVAVVAIGDQAARLAAIESGQIAGTVISIPESTRARQLGFRELLDMSALQAPFQHTAIATTRHFLQANRPAAVRFMAAMLQAVASMRSDRESTMAVMAKYLDLDPVADSALLSAAYDDLIPPYLQATPYPTEAGIQTLLDEALQNNPNASRLTPADLVDRSVIDEALALQAGSSNSQ